jgi:hypothetical protein
VLGWIAVKQRRDPLADADARLYHSAPGLSRPAREMSRERI